MKIEDVKFVQRSDGHNWLLINGYWVKKKTFLHAYAAILANWGAIDWSVRQTAKSMMADAWGDPAVWGLNQALGRCVKYFVTHDMLPLPLEVACKRNGAPYKRGSVKYVLRDRHRPQEASAIPQRPAKRIGAVDPRTIHIDRNAVASGHHLTRKYLKSDFVNHQRHTALGTHPAGGRDATHL